MSGSRARWAAYRWWVTQATIAGICHRLGCRVAYAAAIDSLGGGSKTVAETTLLTNAFLIDCTGSDPRERASVLVEDGTIRELRTGRSPRTRGHDAEIDCSGMTLMPGLTDAHVHIGAVNVNILDQHREYPSNLTVLLMAGILEDTLMQGFTTVRDAGGTDWSFKAAVDRGVVEGPRLLVSDKPLSQTDGHGDWRRRSENRTGERLPGADARHLRGHLGGRRGLRGARERHPQDRGGEEGGHQGLALCLRGGRQDSLGIGSARPLAGPQGTGARDKDRGHEPDGEPHLRHPHQLRALRDGRQDRHHRGGQAR